MHGEKPNSIKTKVDELGSIPTGFSYNHVATWQRLEKNLQVEKHKTYRWWLYAAVIFLLMGSFFMWKLNNQSNVKIVHANKSDKTKEINDKPKIEIELPGNNSQPESMTIPIVINRSGKKPKENDIQQNVTITFPKDTLVTADVSPNNIEIVPKLVVDSAHANVVEKTAKPKFRIAHINELNKPRIISFPSEEKNSVVFKKPLLSSMNEEPLSKEEKTVSRKKSRTIFSPVSSSQ